jgi:large subunit ribosomal protein L16
MPKKLKHRKVRRGKMGGVATRGANVDFGQFGLQSQGRGWITSRQIEAARRAMTRYIRRGGEVWIRVFPDRPVTAQPAETRMGGGKGSLDHFVVTIKPGQVMFEMSGVAQEVAKEAMRLASHKLPVKCKFVTRDED